MAEYVPEVLTIEEIYPAAFVPAQKQRWEQLLSKFQEKYGKKADFVARSPGRVNLIGEHIDYMLFSVLPMAVIADLLLAVHVVPDSTTIKVSNLLEDSFPMREFSIPAEGDLEIDASKHEWSNYFRAGYRGAIELLRKKGIAVKKVGLEVLVDGSVPAGGGLSSSAAFVCASALAGLEALGNGKVDKKELVNLAIVSERYIGVNSGGMDQSASVLSLKGQALHIDFHPTLNATPVAFPNTNPELTFVIANTFVKADKQATGPIQYNLRVVEATLAAEMLAKMLNLGPLPKDEGPLGSTLKGLMDLYFKTRRGSDEPVLNLQEQYKEMERVVEKYLDKEEGYTREEMAQVLDVSVDELIRQYMTKFPICAQKFHLRPRALHIFTESHRVISFNALLSSQPPSTIPLSPSVSKTLLTSLGTLMNESQASCRDLYDCSCPELDTLCRLAREAGAYGSRLTGAGWGGCSVHLVPMEKVDSIKELWRREYYEGRFLEQEGEEGIEKRIREGVVVSGPGCGAVLKRVL